MKQTDLKLNGVSANIDLCGYFDAEIRPLQYMSCFKKIYVAHNRTENLLSRLTSVELCLIKRLNNVSISQGLCLMTCDPVTIVLKENAVPYNSTTPWCVSQPLAPKVEAKIQKMLKDGVTVLVEKETDWCSPIVPVLKPREVYQREMNKILHSLPGCDVYQDDAIMHGGTMEEHDA